MTPTDNPGSPPEPEVWPTLSITLQPPGGRPLGDLALWHPTEDMPIFWLSGDLREVFDVDRSEDGNQTAEAHLRELVAETNPGLAQRTVFGSEDDTFYAEAASHRDADELFEFIVRYAESLPPEVGILLPFSLEGNDFTEDELGYSHSLWLDPEDRMVYARTDPIRAETTHYSANRGPTRLIADLGPSPCDVALDEIYELLKADRELLMRLCLTYELDEAGSGRWQEDQAEAEAFARLSAEIEELAAGGQRQIWSPTEWFAGRTDLNPYQDPFEGELSEVDLVLLRRGVRAVMVEFIASDALVPGVEAWLRKRLHVLESEMANYLEPEEQSAHAGGSFTAYPIQGDTARGGLGPETSVCLRNTWVNWDQLKKEAGS